MRMTDCIIKKRNGQELSDEEIRFVVEGYTAGIIPDYQMAALLMAGFLNGFDEAETAQLTQCMARSGEQLDLSSIPGIKVDKHSTGGVGDKTTLIVGPMAAACGVPVAKMSGRGLGHTGGTADKLESIPGYRIGLSTEEFVKQVREIGIALVGQTGNLAPADKRIYALRDVTGTVESIPLIAASIMSKKIAAGADAILLDVKVGSGAFMKTKADAKKLAETMKAIGERAGRKTAAVLTDMEMPLGRTIGNALEAAEAVDVLRGRGEARLTALCIELTAQMLVLADKGELPDCRRMAQQSIADGSAFRKLCEVVCAQGGDVRCIEHPERLARSPICTAYRAKASGFISRIDTQKCGMAACVLGAGRERKEDAIDYGAGIVLHKNYSDAVSSGDVIAELYTSEEERLKPAQRLLDEAFIIGTEHQPSVPFCCRITPAHAPSLD